MSDYSNENKLLTLKGAKQIYDTAINYVNGELASIEECPDLVQTEPLGSIATPPQKVDNVDVASGNKILVIGQTNLSENGLYTVSDSAGALTWEPSAVSNNYLVVKGGNTNKGKIFIKTTKGTDKIKFKEIKNSIPYSRPGKGYGSIEEGIETSSLGNYQKSLGRYNLPDNNSVEIVGWGEGETLPQEFKYYKGNNTFKYKSEEFFDNTLKVSLNNIQIKESYVTPIIKENIISDKTNFPIFIGNAGSPINENSFIQGEDYSYRPYDFYKLLMNSGSDYPIFDLNTWMGQVYRSSSEEYSVSITAFQAKGQPSPQDGYSVILSCSIKVYTKENPTDIIYEEKNSSFSEVSFSTSKNIINSTLIIEVNDVQWDALADEKLKIFNKFKFEWENVNIIDLLDLNNPSLSNKNLLNYIMVRTANDIIRSNDIGEPINLIFNENSTLSVDTTDNVSSFTFKIEKQENIKKLKNIRTLDRKGNEILSGSLTINKNMFLDGKGENLVSYLEGSYDEINNLKKNNLLIPGKIYIINDFKSTFYEKIDYPFFEAFESILESFPSKYTRSFDIEDMIFRIRSNDKVLKIILMANSKESFLENGFAYSKETNEILKVKYDFNLNNNLLTEDQNSLIELYHQNMYGVGKIINLSTGLHEEVYDGQKYIKTSCPSLEEQIRQNNLVYKDANGSYIPIEYSVSLFVKSPLTNDSPVLVTGGGPYASPKYPVFFKLQVGGESYEYKPLLFNKKININIKKCYGTILSMEDSNNNYCDFDFISLQHIDFGMSEGTPSNTFFSKYYYTFSNITSDYSGITIDTKDKRGSFTKVKIKQNTEKFQGKLKYERVYPTLIMDEDFSGPIRTFYKGSQNSIINIDNTNMPNYQTPYEGEVKIGFYNNFFIYCKNLNIFNLNITNKPLDFLSGVGQANFLSSKIICRIYDSDINNLIISYSDSQKSEDNIYIKDSIINNSELNFSNLYIDNSIINNTHFSNNWSSKQVKIYNCEIFNMYDNSTPGVINKLKLSSNFPDLEKCYIKNVFSPLIEFSGSNIPTKLMKSEIKNISSNTKIILTDNTTSGTNVSFSQDLHKGLVDDGSSTQGPEQKS